MKNLKICILIIGRLDTFETCYESLRKYILEPLNVDVFFSGYPNFLGLEYCENKIEELWKPKKYCLRDYTDIIRKEIHLDDSRFIRKRSECTPHTWLSGMYNLKISNKLKNEYEKENNFKYDICIKSRTDVIWHSYITNEEIDLVLKDSKNILIPTAWDFKEVHNLGCSDVSCVTSSHGMDIYSSCIDFIDEYYDSGEVFHPESLLGIHINNFLNRISIKTGIDPHTNQPNQSGWCVIDPNRKKSF